MAGDASTKSKKKKKKSKKSKKSKSSTKNENENDKILKSQIQSILQGKTVDEENDEIENVSKSYVFIF